jgi:SAM-dependent methyltransferase
MPDSYDRIAPFYDVDMARNMPFDDVGFYAERCTERTGRVLELGCGNGRILLELLARGIDAVGIDASEPMLRELQRKATARSLSAPVARMDIRRLALHSSFATILCPYSLITYVIDDRDLAATLAGIRRLLDSDGAFVVDAFVPRSPPVDREFQLDYERQMDEFTLARWKRIVPLGPARNRIERRYRVLAPDDTAVDAVDVTEVIRPFAPQALCELLSGAGFVVERAWWDYGHGSDPQQARFFTVEARLPAR